MPTTNFTSKSFNVNTPGTYQYFRLYITQNGGDDLIQLSEFSINGEMQEPMFTGVTIESSNPSAVSSSDEKVSFTGTYAYMSFDTDDKSKLFLGGDNTLYYPEAGASIGAQRAYFQLDGITAGASPSGEQGGLIRAFVLNFADGQETAISAQPILNSQFSILNSAWYTLDGRKLSGKPTKAGLYIVNGKKVVIK